MTGLNDQRRMEQNSTVSRLPSYDQRHVHTTKHQYGTRIRSNSVLKPSARLRQSPDPPPLRRIKPLPTTPKLAQPAPTYPPFPPPHVVLHPDDATNKVFLAIGRALTSVDNRAMTIKDLAEMTLKFGLVCQNVSAASQAITTYIRTHLARCDAQGDHPLLLRHRLSGTQSDDRLLPALHSRTGGAHCTGNSETRVTNFRRGTMVWYLSRAAGAPCPFARSGISLYGRSERGCSPTGALEYSKREKGLGKFERCGQKRKRMTRRCVGRSNNSESSEDETPRPPKVKLTLRLRPSMVTSASAETSSMSSLPSTPVSSQEIIDLSTIPDDVPVDTPTYHSDSECDDGSNDSESVEYSSAHDSDSSFEEGPIAPRRDQDADPIDIPIPAHDEMFSLSRSPPPDMDIACPPSPSTGSSFASFPPDSDPEEDYFAIDEPDISSYESDDWYEDFNDTDEDATRYSEVGESPGPRSPSAPPTNPTDITVKQEDSLELIDPFEGLSGAPLKYLEGTVDGIYGGIEVKSEDYAPPFAPGTDQSWDRSPEWLTRSLPMDADLGVEVKQEDMGFESPLPSTSEHDAISPFSPYSSVSSHSSNFFSASRADLLGFRRNSESLWRNVELLGPEDVHPKELDESYATPRQRTVRARAKTYPTLPSLSPCASNSKTTIEDSVPAAAPTPPTPPTPVPARRDISQVSPAEVSVVPEESTLYNQSSPEVIVQTCQPCTPTICAVQVEGISVYQTTLGSSYLLRRIDTDFVNLSPIIQFLNIPSPPPTTMPNSMLISQGSSAITGLWVPLLVAQSFAKEHPVPRSLIDVFLSDMLYERFPPALQDFHLSKRSGRLLGHFGPHFKSTLDQRRLSQLTIRTEYSSPDKARVWGPNWDVVADHMLSTHPSYPPTLKPLVEPVLDMVHHTPLSPLEQEIFHSLCGNVEWDEDNELAMVSEACAPAGEAGVQVLKKPARSAPDPRTLRRSKRVAKAIATIQPGPVTRSRRQSPRKPSN